jgi:hypothetical protein
VQVVVNPLLRVAGGEAHFAFYSILSQLVVGMPLLKFFDSRKVLVGGAVGSLICLTAALFGPA